MKKKDITYQDKLNELRLDVLHPNNIGIVFVFVEGESDIRLFRKFFNLDCCKVESIPGGNAKLESCVNEIVGMYPLAIGIRDADFIQLGTAEYSKTNMFLTDYHDIEMSLISEDEVFSSILHEFTEEKKENHSVIKDKIFQTLEQLSYLRWLNEIEKLELKFEAGYQDLISFAKSEIDITTYFHRILSKSPNAKIKDLAVILSKVIVLKSASPDPLHLCNGHDFMKYLSKYIRETESSSHVSDDIVASAFRFSFGTNF